MITLRKFARLASGAALLAGCGGGVGSTDDAQRVYTGLDPSIDRALQLGFDGFNAAQSANIPDQKAAGTKGGTMTIGGKVDQGSSSNKTMSLTEVLAKYTDDGLLVYDTTAPAALDLKLSKIPDGTLSGTLTGSYTVSGDLAGTVTLDVSLAATLQPVASDATKVERQPGSTHITGTASSDFGSYTIDLTR
jgi:hypothetical protein